MIIQIAAAAENNALGKDNKLVWHLPNDFKRFKEITSGHYIILGRKTFESFPKPLPNRTHVIITRNKNYKAEGCIIVNSLEEALNKVPKNQDTYIIGGAEIYKQSINITDKIELTRVHTTCEADAFFPEINLLEWKLIFEEHHSKDEKHNFNYTFQTFVKK
ncbi:dihydrofolate reductase [Flavobacterium sp.]|uniref:dihydrofolate reductase n=1 Tax=Flavobacterium sp. TaxID=239 RepID=UPI003751EFB6